MVLLTMFTSKILQISSRFNRPQLTSRFWSKSDVSVPSNDTGVEQQGTPAGGAVQRIPVASSVRVSFGALPYSRNIDVLPRWKTCGGALLEGNSDLNKSL